MKRNGVLRVQSLFSFESFSETLLTTVTDKVFNFKEVVIGASKKLK